ncbi:MAG: glutathione S-transferase family protein [Pseudomonadota bacterium]
MKLERHTIKTEEVLGWQGLHLLNFAQSSCSQKVRVLLAEKGIDYRSHEIDLKKLEHATPWFLGLNPRGVVPVLVHDGDVHIESNDILAYIEKTFPSASSWLPETAQERYETHDLMQLEARLHDHLRAITMGFLAPRKLMAKSDPELEAYRANGPDNAYRDQQIAWWRDFGSHGVSEVEAQRAIAAFEDAFAQLNARLEGHGFLIADHPTLADISWFISVHRLAIAGYKLERHPWLTEWYAALLRRTAFRKEIAKAPLSMRIAGPLYRLSRRWRGTDLGPLCKAPVTAPA